jgi:hypothetical protein
LNGVKFQEFDECADGYQMAEIQQASLYGMFEGFACFIA